MAEIEDGLKKNQTFGDLAELIVNLFLANQIPEVRTQDPQLPKHLQNNVDIPGKSYGFTDVLNLELRKRGIPGGAFECIRYFDVEDDNGEYANAVLYKPLDEDIPLI